MATTMMKQKKTKKRVLLKGEVIKMMKCWKKEPVHQLTMAIVLILTIMKKRTKRRQRILLQQKNKKHRHFFFLYYFIAILLYYKFKY
mmetsp:Transcript_28136/g.41814  ORF Transcript_28136/g.41814 Transcript_28136/m.41814 type:complete len:87 (+) Transcript_28136:70-330(+)